MAGLSLEVTALLCVGSAIDQDCPVLKSPRLPKPAMSEANRERPNIAVLFAIMNMAHESVEERSAAKYHADVEQAPQQAMIGLHWQTDIHASPEPVFALPSRLARPNDRWPPNSTVVEPGPLGMRHGRVREFDPPVRLCFEQPMTCAQRPWV